MTCWREMHPQGKRASKARREGDTLLKPETSEIPDGAVRDAWLKDTIAGFVGLSRRNKEYYAVILETVWTKGHGIPGPIVTEDDLREAIDAYRRNALPAGATYKPYKDVFRRVRELQGEEGLTCLIKSGTKYQLVSLELGPKRTPRERPSAADWAGILAQHGGRCAVCGREEPARGFQPDHKIPRLRGGAEQGNWQPLCPECNNFKSTSCRGCELECSECAWAFPEKWALIRLTPGHVEIIRDMAEESSQAPSDVLEHLIDVALELD